MKNYSYLYDDLSDINKDRLHDLHEKIKRHFTIDELVSIAVCMVIRSDNHTDIEKKLNNIERRKQ